MNAPTGFFSMRNAYKSESKRGGCDTGTDEFGMVASALKRAEVLVQGICLAYRKIQKPLPKSCLSGTRKYREIDAR